MATQSKKKRPAIPERPDPKEALKQLQSMEQPKMKWKVLGQIALGLAVVWLIAGMLSPYISFWGYVVAGLLTLVIAGFALYIWNMMRKSSHVMNILKGATDDEGRAAAIAALSEKGDDVMAKMAQSQLVAAEDPKEATRILESIDLAKAPKLLQNDVRAQLALMYLIQNRSDEARALANEIKIEAQAQAKQKGMYAAVVAEAFARTGKAEGAAELLKDYSPDDPEYDEMKPLLYRAEVFTSMALKKRGRARTAMMRLVDLDPNHLSAFLQKGARPDLAKLAKEVLEKKELIPRQRVRYR